MARTKAHVRAQLTAAAAADAFLRSGDLVELRKRAAERDREGAPKRVVHDDPAQHALYFPWYAVIADAERTLATISPAEPDGDDEPYVPEPAPRSPAYSPPSPTDPFSLTWDRLIEADRAAN